MNEVLYPMAVIAVVAIVTWILRAFPFLLFGNRPLPKTILYLGKVLPVPEIVACAMVAALQIIRRNMYLSIIAGTICYMILIRIV